MHHLLVRQKIEMKLALNFLLSLVLLTSACSKNEATLDSSLFPKNGIPEEVAQIVLPHAKGTEQLTSYDENFEQKEVSGVVLKASPSEGMAKTLELRNALQSYDSQAYFYDNSYGYDPDLIAIVNTKDDIEYLRLVRTDGINYDITSEKVVEKYAKWDEEYDLELVGAGMDWLEARVHGDQVDWSRFAKEAYSFCPDIVDQGTGTIEKLEAEMKKGKTLYLWWD